MDPRLPIPNREVKHTNAAGTAPPGGSAGRCRFSDARVINFTRASFSVYTTSFFYFFLYLYDSLTNWPQMLYGGRLVVYFIIFFTYETLLLARYFTSVPGTCRL